MAFSPCPGLFLSPVAMRRGLHLSILRWYDWSMTVGCVSANARETFASGRVDLLNTHSLTYQHSTMSPVQHATGVLTASPRRPLADAKVGAGQDERGKRAIYWNRETSAAPCAPAIEGRSAGGA